VDGIDLDFVVYGTSANPAPANAAPPYAADNIIIVRSHLTITPLDSLLMFLALRWHLWLVMCTLHRDDASRS
jgi:hypothetical protein